MSTLQHARLQWGDDDQPVSAAFADVYFSKQSGLDESRYVFLQHNQLAERFAALAPTQPLVVAETGFGTGLNFLCTWQLFLQHAPADARLQFISVEKFPLQRHDLQRALALWPELRPLADALLAQYHAIQPGYQTFVFQEGRIRLTLLIGDAVEQLSTLDANVDAWFLDGFAPAKNPEMWTDDLFGQLARLSQPHTTLATFTSAGFVRRGLIAAGFNMRRVPGFGFKRDMLCGTLNTPAAPSWAAPWYARPPADSATPERHAIVIGGGLSGCATAYSLAQRGWSVTLIERLPQIAQAASGNAQGVLYLKLSAAHTPLSQWVLAGFGYTRRLLAHWGANPDWDACGVLQLAYSEQEAERQQRLAQVFSPDLLYPVEAQQASEHAGITLQQGGLFFPEAGWVNPPALCRFLTQHPNIRLRTATDALTLTRVDPHWQVNSAQGVIASASVVVVANAQDATAFAQTAHLPLKAIRGQVSRLPATAPSRALQCVISATGYIAPAYAEQHCVGASFNFDHQGLDLSLQDHLSNLANLQQLSPTLHDSLRQLANDAAGLQGHAALRCTSPDYLPVVGPVADSQRFAERYQRLSKDARQQLEDACPWQSGLYVNTGQGSRGLITAPLAGELVAALINQDALPLPQPLVDASHPNRFALRTLIRRQ